MSCVCPHFWGVTLTAVEYTPRPQLTHTKTGTYRSHTRTPPSHTQSPRTRSGAGMPCRLTYSAGRQAKRALLGPKRRALWRGASRPGGGQSENAAERAARRRSAAWLTSSSSRRPPTSIRLRCATAIASPCATWRARGPPQVELRGVAGAGIGRGAPAGRVALSRSSASLPGALHIHFQTRFLGAPCAQARVHGRTRLDHAHAPARRTCGVH